MNNVILGNVLRIICFNYIKYTIKDALISVTPYLNTKPVIFKKIVIRIC